MLSGSRSRRLEAGEGPVVVLHYEQDVEHADDAPFDQVQHDGYGLTGHRRVGRIGDDDDVDRAELQLLVGFHWVSFVRLQVRAAWILDRALHAQLIRSG